MASPAPVWLQTTFALALVAGGAIAWLERDALSAAIGRAPAAAETADAADPGVPIVAAAVEPVRDDAALRVAGSAHAARSVTLRPETGGKVAEIAIAANRRFSEGEVLLRLEDTDERLALALAEARLAEAERTLGRQEALRSRGTVSETALSDAQTARDIAAIARDRAAAALDDRTLEAPFDGVTGIAQVERGDWIDTDTAIASFDDRSRLLVEFALPERWLPRLEIGQTVGLETPGHAGEALAGRIAEIDSRVDPATRTARVRAELDNSDDALRPGLSFTVTLELPGEPYPAVPALALQFERGGSYVWRVSSGRAEKVSVRVVRRRAGRILVDGPLAAGDRVAVEGVQRLRPGRKIRGVEEAPAALAQGGGA